MAKNHLTYFKISALCLISFIAPAQSPVADSLRLLLRYSLKDTSQVNLLNDLALEVNRKIDYAALGYANQALELATKLNYKKGIADAYSNLGYYHRYNLLDSKLAISNYEKAAALHLEVHEMNKYATDLIHIGGVYQSESRLQSALELYTQAAAVLEGKINYRNSGLAYELIGSVYADKSNFTLAEKYYFLALGKYELNKRYPLVAQVHVSLAEMFLKDKKPDKAIQHAVNSYQLAAQLNSHYGLIMGNCIAGEAYILKRNYDSAYYHLNLSNLLNQANRANRIYESRINHSLGWLFFETGQWVKAKKTLLLAINAKPANIFVEDRRNANRLLAQVCEKMGEVNQSIRYYREYIQLNDSLQLSRSKVIIDDIEAFYKSEKQAKENEMLKMKLDMDSAKIHRQNLLLVLAFITLSAGFLFMLQLYRSRRQIRKRNKLLSTQNFEIQAQNEEIKSQQEEIAMQAEQLALKNEFLRNKNEELEELNREKDGLVSVVAHDLRAPINQSKGFAELLRTTALDSDQLSLVNMITRVSDDGLHLIRDLLQVNALNHGELEPSTIVLDQFIQETIEKSFRPIADKKGIKLHMAVEKKLRVTTDHQYLRRVLENLVSNALKFSTAGSNVFLRVLSSNDSIYISVEDQGPGISIEDQKKMFRKFQKLSARPTSGESSTGLGLAIVKGLVEKLGGELKVISEIGKGSSFIIRLSKTFHASAAEFENMDQQQEG